MNQSSGIKNIIFDFGGVIIDLDYSRTRKAFEDLGVSVFNNHFNQLRQTDLFDAFDKGKISEREFRDMLNQQLGTHFTDEEIDNAWNAMLLGIREEKLKLLGELYADFHTYLLSNTNIIHLKYITKYLIRNHGRANLDALFDKVYYSFTMGHRKPEPEIYKKVIEENSLRPFETLFIDDSPQHVEGARAVGLLALQFRQGDDLGAFLKPYIERTVLSGER